MKSKTLAIAPLLLFLLVIQVSYPGKRRSLQENSGIKVPSITPLSGLVMLVDIKLIDNIPVIEEITSKPGRCIEKSTHLERIKTTALSRRPELCVLEESGNIIYKTKFEFPRFMTIPMPQSGAVDPYTPARIPIEEPEVTLVIPHYEEAAFIQVAISGDAKFSTTMRIDSIKSHSSFLPRPTPADESRFHILIMADNYDASNMDHFHNVANSIKELIYSMEPFSTYSSQIEIHIYPNTADLGCYGGCNNIDRLICCNSSQVISAAASSGFLYDEIIVVYNTSDYGGAGYREWGDAYKFNSYSTYAITYGGTESSVLQEEVAVHELGHSFGNLCDEYTYTDEGISYKDCVNCRANCGDWDSISSICQQSCDAKEEYFRPEDSIMLSLSLLYFNKVSLKSTYFPDGLEKRLEYFVETDSYVLTINSTIGGITIPSPGNYHYRIVADVSITAIPEKGYKFNGWSGDVSGIDNPIRIIMDSDKYVNANFEKHIYPPLNFKGRTVLNRSLSQAEYINVLTWEANSNNKNIEKYRIYLIDGASKNFLVELDADAFHYWHRRVDKDRQYVYALVAVNNEQMEGDAVRITVQ